MTKGERGTGAETVVEPAVPVHEITEYWYDAYGTSPVVYIGTLCLKSRRSGKQTTEQEHLEAIIVFKKGPTAGTGGTR